MNPDIQILSAPAPFSMADDWYQYASADHFWIQWRFARVRRLLRDLDIGDHIMDVGCGNAVVRDQLEDCYHRPVDGCDLNLSALRLARSGRGKLYLYDVHDRRDEWEELFTCVFLLDTLEHVEHAAGFLDSIRFHLSKEGLLVINVPAVQSLYGRYDQVQGHVKRYSVPGLAEELAAGGFRLIRCSYWGFTMLPIAFLRKGVLRFVRSEHVMARGFQPGSRLTESFLRLLMNIENVLLPRPWIGTSIAAVARRAV